MRGSCACKALGASLARHSHDTLDEVRLIVVVPTFTSSLGAIDLQFDRCHMVTALEELHITRLSTVEARGIQTTYDLFLPCYPYVLLFYKQVGKR